MTTIQKEAHVSLVAVFVLFVFVLVPETGYRITFEGTFEHVAKSLAFLVLAVVCWRQIRQPSLDEARAAQLRQYATTLTGLIGLAEAKEKVAIVGGVLADLKAIRAEFLAQVAAGEKRQGFDAADDHYYSSDQPPGGEA